MSVLNQIITQQIWAQAVFQHNKTVHTAERVAGKGINSSCLPQGQLAVTSFTITLFFPHILAYAGQNFAK